ncbi:MAG TPA: hypothetical protein VGV62_02885 [Xanthobacteraceae bacterium]|nr:hypothetical protein [Xanthobacteraceae bacterium]
MEAAIRKLEMELMPARSKKRATTKSSQRTKPAFAEVNELGEIPKALAAMLLGIGYLAAVVGFSGVVYLRGLALVYADIIQYPILLGAMAVLVCLLIPLSRTVFRKLRLYSRGAVAVMR